MFAVLVTVVSALGSVYARYYITWRPKIRRRGSTRACSRFYACFLAFMGAMLGVVLAGNLVQLVFG